MAEEGGQHVVVIAKKFESRVGKVRTSGAAAWFIVV
jgi:hypothetical protein